MNKVTCTECKTTLRAADAHLRSIAFERVAWCKSCWALLQAVREVVDGAMV